MDADLFKVPVCDLGAVEDPRFEGIAIPEPEINLPREGVNDVFLANAEEYYRKFQGFDHSRALIRRAVEVAQIENPKRIVEFGAGFGNATLPLVDLFPDCHVVATDISPQMLAILRRLLVNRGLLHRCTVVAMDAHKDYLHGGTADMVLGSAILHHLVNPGLLVGRAIDLLKPGGWAIFFEPFEAGYAVIRMMCLLAMRKARLRDQRVRAFRLLKRLALAAARRLPGPQRHGFQYLEEIARGLTPQVLRERRVPEWRNLNDKWAFPRSVLEDIQVRAGASRLIVYPLHDNTKPFTRHIRHVLKTSAGVDESVLPPWVWEFFDQFETEFFSPELLTDFIIEGAILYRK